MEIPVLRLGIVAGWLASALLVHLRGRERHGFLRQLVDHSTFVGPYNLLAYLFSSVPGRPYQDLARFPELTALRENWEVIREEALALLDGGRLRAAERRDDLAFNTFFRRGWRRFYVRWYDATLPSARELCPRTAELVEALPSVTAALFAVLPPGARLGRHRDPFAGALRYHLGLETPRSDACRIWVDGQPYAWRDGQDVLFDPTFVHEVRNETDARRLILFCDVRRPLRQPMRALNELVTRYVLRATAAHNLPGEKLGALNRVAGIVQRGKEAAKRAKRRNKTAYRVVKALVLGAALLALLFL